MVVDLLVDPRALVIWAVNLRGLPPTLVFSVLNHRWFPISIHLFVPVLGLLIIRVRDVLRLDPFLTFRVHGVINLGLLIQVLRLRSTRILYLLGWYKVPIILQGAWLHLAVVNLHLVGVIGPHNQCIRVCEFITLATDVLID